MIASEDDLTRTLKMPQYYVKLVRQITWCGSVKRRSTEFRYYGYTDLGPRTFVVARHADPKLEPVIWAHEYGHSKGLRDVPIPGLIMYPEARIGSTKLQLGDCKTLDTPETGKLLRTNANGFRAENIHRVISSSVRRRFGAPAARN